MREGAHLGQWGRRARTARFCGLLLIASAVWVVAAPLGTAFTYQGRLTDGGSPANGSYDLEFKLFDASSLGNEVGSAVTLTSVTVTNGLFTVSLDFGAGTPGGNKRWLEIGVRPGGTAGAFSTLAPRQELTAAPSAQYAVSAGTVAGLTCSNGQVAKWSGSSWTCGDDLDTNNGGTVTGVSAGSGLSGGTITTSGTLGIAPGGVTSSMIATGAVGSTQIAAGAVGSAQINTAQVQTRLAAICPGGHFLRGVNADGGVVCETIYALPTSTTVAQSAVGAYTSIAIGNDGLPVISHLDQPGGTLRVAKCGNASCSAGNTLSTVDDPPSNYVGEYTSIAIGSDGFPVISYHDNTAGTLKVAKCANAACTGTSTITTVDAFPGKVLGQYTSIAIGSDGFPVISHFGDGSLKVAKCGNASCTSGNILATVDPGGSVGQYSSIAIGTDGFPVISYQDGLNLRLKVAKCGNASCTSGNVITTVDAPVSGLSELGFGTSIAIGTDGLPVISYQENLFSKGALKVAKCVNSACSGASAITTVDAPPTVIGQYTSIAIGTDGLPVISYQDATAYTLKVVKCGNASCTSGNTITIADDPPSDHAGGYSSIAVGTDGLPVISHNQTAAALRVTKCAKASCAP